jgi:hypothetical protein
MIRSEWGASTFFIDGENSWVTGQHFVDQFNSLSDVQVAEKF